MPTADGDGAHLENVVEDDLVVFGPEKPFVVQFKFKMKIRKINLPSRDPRVNKMSGPIFSSLF